MASMKPALTQDEVKKVGSLSKMKTEYNRVADIYTKMVDGEYLRCPSCGEVMKADTAFYFDKRYVSSRYPICKRCIQKLVEQRNRDNDEPNETKESVQRVLQMMDRVYDNDFYESCIKGAEENLKEKNRTSPFSTYITATSSLPQYRGLTWKDSKFGEVADENEQAMINENSRIAKAARKRFGSDYPLKDLIYLETEYEDWTSRYACENKAQELLFKRICFVELNIEKAQREGKDTKELDKTLQEIMSSLQVKPSQSNSNALTEAKTFGELIQIWEKSKPIPEPEDEFKDVDQIGLLIDVFFKGHMAKMMGIKNAFSNLYENFMQKYTVKKPEYMEDENTEALFDQIFGDRVKDG